MADDQDLDIHLMRDLSALADGSLPEERRAATEAKVAASPELAAIVADQREAVEAVRATLPLAPDRLRARVHAMGAKSRPTHRRWLMPAGGLAAAAAAVAAALVLAIGGNAAAPTVADAAALTVRPAVASAPAPEQSRPLLEASVGGIAFPDWAAAFGWRAVGQRTDKLDGRHTVTVFYAKGSKRIGYTIVDGTALAWPDGARQTIRRGTDVRSIELSGRTVVTWRRDGHSCVMSAGKGVSRSELVTLAAWRDGGSLVY